MPDQHRDPYLLRLAARFTPTSPPPGGSVLASGEEVNLSDVTAIQDVLNRRQRWQYQALDAHEACGELNYGVSQLSGAVAKLRIFVADRPTNVDSLPEPTKNDRAAKVIEQLGSVIDRAELQRRIAEQMFITGEPYMIYQKEKGTWNIHSIEEVQVEGRTVAIRNAPNDDKPVKILPENGDTWVRLLHQSARWSSQATSHLRAILDDVDELIWWSAAGSAHAKNRLAINGALGIPTSLEAPIESEEDAKFTGSERFLRKFYRRATETLKNPRAASAAVPFLFTYPDNDSRKSGLDFVDMKRASDDLIEQRTDRAIQRISHGINLPKDVLLGPSEGSGSSHFTLEAVTESFFLMHVEPPTLLILNALTTAWLRPILKKLGLDPNDFLLWYDASNLIAKPDMSQAADFGVQHALINDKAWRRTRNFSEDDKPTPEERAEIIEMLQVTRGRIAPGQSESGAPINPDDTPVLPDKSPTRTTTPNVHPPKEQPPTPARGKGQPAIAKPVAASANGSSNGHADAVLVAQLQILADTTIRRALERAGARIRNKAQRNANWKKAIAKVPAEDVAKTLGKDAVTKLGMDDVFEGCFEHASQRTRVLVASVSIQSANVTRSFIDSLQLLACEKLFSPPGLEMVVSEDWVRGKLSEVKV